LSTFYSSFDADIAGKKLGLNLPDIVEGLAQMKKEKLQLKK